jgi:adenine phosphoribosyltransferase
MADRYYELKVAGCTRQLPIIPISPTLAIAGFVILGDVELVGNAARELVKKVPAGTDYLVAAETKGIPLVHEMARLMGVPRYVVARKSIKAYMEHPLVVEDESITTKGKQILVLQDADIDLIRGKNVLLVDDVISTGGSMKALEELVTKAGAKVMGRQAILAEGDSIGRRDITVLADLPLFPLK